MPVLLNTKLFLAQQVFWFHYSHLFLRFQIQIQLVYVGRSNPCMRLIAGFHWRATKNLKKGDDSINKDKNLGDGTRLIFEQSNFAKLQFCAVFHSHDNNWEKCFTQIFRALAWRSSNMATVTQQKSWFLPSTRAFITLELGHIEITTLSYAYWDLSDSLSIDLSDSVPKLPY